MMRCDVYAYWLGLVTAQTIAARTDHISKAFVIAPLGLFDLTNVDLSLLYLLLFNEVSGTDHPTKQHFPRYVT
jgi:hypothetical protein